MAIDGERDIDRLSREGPLAILSLVNSLKLVSVKVISYQESWTEAPREMADLLYAIHRMGSSNGEPEEKREDQSRISSSKGPR